MWHATHQEVSTGDDEGYQALLRATADYHDPRSQEHYATLVTWLRNWHGLRYGDEYDEHLFQRRSTSIFE